jgi:large subunit ribosomal protein L23
MRDPRDVIIAPIVSEKSYGLLDENVYTFKVHPGAAKPEIRDAVQSIFGVRVKSVNTLNRKGKRKRNRRSWTYGKKADTKRAMVTLVEGESIDLFES